MTTFKAILLSKSDAGVNAALADIDEAQLPTEGDVTVAIEYSTLNYKDGLAIANKSPVVRKWPMVAGIDGAGTVESSNHPDWKPGDKVIHTGFGKLWEKDNARYAKGNPGIGVAAGEWLARQSPMLVCTARAARRANGDSQ